MKYGFAGRLAQQFIQSKLTPIIILSSLLLGFGAIWFTPKEEEPQIIVPMIDIQLAAPGLDAAEVERYVTEVAERELWGIEGVDYIYSASQSHGSLITVRFKVGQSVEESLLKVHHHMTQLRAEWPAQVSVASIQSLSIDDVPFLAITFSSKTRNGYDLRKDVAPLARQLSSTPEVSKTSLLGGLRRVIRVRLDPALLAKNGVNAVDVRRVLSGSQAHVSLGKNWRTDQSLDVALDAKLTTKQHIADMPIAQRAGRVLYLKDVAAIEDGPEQRTRASVLYDKTLGKEPREAVTLVFSKRKGANVVALSDTLLAQLDLAKTSLPADIRMSVIRNYGESAHDKTKVLIEHLLIATVSVAALIALFMGFRAALVVIVAIPVTLALTLAIYYFLGYTLNRVTFFALIFSIGILVDDAIVVVENIERHLKESPGKGMIATTVAAVSEVGNPTILATFTVIAAILPMAFVQGLMGPYMKPIPVGASLAMVLSLLVAFTVTPWVSARLLTAHSTHGTVPKKSRLDDLYRRIMDTLLSSRKAGALFVTVTLVLLIGAMSMIGMKWIKVKMLPFDNKNEFQILLDYPSETSMEQALAQTRHLAQALLTHPDVEKVQLFKGEPAPFSFSGMVKHTFLRRADSQVDLHVVLSDKHKRTSSSHEIIQSLRPTIRDFAKTNHLVSKVLEIPPGPPVMATLVAEVYGANREQQDQVAKQVRAVFDTLPSIVDLDDSMRIARSQRLYPYNYTAGGQLGTSAWQVAELGQLIFSETPILTLNNAQNPEPLTLVLSINPESRSGERPFKNHSIHSFDSGLVDAEQVILPGTEAPLRVLHRKNLRPVSYVMAELSGEEEAPVYAILALQKKISFDLRTVRIPWPIVSPVVKWDGEWFLTYEVFRDLGASFLVVMVLIYVLILGWFRRFTLPLVIMTPIPISLIGIIPGHWVTGAYFTATSMIGFIAGAGIIVRNSIILVDFIEHQIDQGMALKEAVISAGVLRFRPMLLTAGAVVVGSMVMLADPIFQGLAVSLMFGEVSATLLSRFAVPLLYYWQARRYPKIVKGMTHD